MIVVLIATAWGSAEGGINAFNYALTIGLAQTGSEVRVYCALPNPSEADIRDAAEYGVEIIKVGSDVNRRPTNSCGNEVLSWLSDKSQPWPDLWIGHDVITGFIALASAELSGKAAIIHHMAYLSYQNASGGRGDTTLNKHSEQRRLFSDKSAIFFGVGPLLTSGAMALGAERAVSITPGFPSNFTKNISDDRDLKVIVAGRFEAHTESLKQSKIAVAALARAVSDADGNIPCLENPTMILFGASPE